MASYIFGILTIALCSVLFYFSYTKAKNHRTTYSLLLILVAGCVMRVTISLDADLHEWDEKYHALVGKHTITSPLKPTLYENPVLPYDYQNWTANHIWLEKGPIPFILIGTSVSIFGQNPFSVRLPSIIVGILSIFLTFLIGSKLMNNQVGLIAAALHSINGLLIELVGGRISSDHVETLFIFFIELAIYAAIVFSLKEKYSVLRAALIGVIVGFAVLTKWFPALIVFPVWFSYLIFQHKGNIVPILYFGGISILATIVVVLPVFQYYNHQYPREFDWVIHKFLFAYSAPIENHSAPWYYYIHKVGVIFGELVYLPLALAIFQLKKNNNTGSLLMLNVWWLIPLIIFSLGDTKRFTYLMISAPAIFILTATACTFYYKKYLENKKKLSLLIVLLLLSLPIRYSLERQKLFSHDFGLHHSDTALVSVMASKYDPEATVIFNVKQNIQAMFYTDFIVYPQNPTEKELELLKSEGYQIVIFDEDLQELVVFDQN